jgi:hypothetical protein
MTAQDAERSVRFRGRLSGAFYILNIVAGASALFLHGTLASVVLLIATVCYLGVTALFYDLFRPVSRTLSLTAACLSLVGCTISVLTTLRLAAIDVSPLVFFGCYCLLIGYLILRSTFLPRVLGVLMALGGLGWLTFVSPELSSRLSPYNLAPGIIGETALAFWLIGVGLNAQRWLEQAGRKA